MRTLGVIIIVILSVAIISMLVIYAVRSIPSVRTENMDVTAYITFGNGQEAVIRVGGYTRVSQGWIVIKSADGTTYCTNERNVLLMKTPRK